MSCIADDFVPKAQVSHLVHVFDADDLFVSSGANLGDALGGFEALCVGDVYELDSQASLRALAIERQGAQLKTHLGEEVEACGRLVFMAPDAQKAEVLVLRCGACLSVLPLTPLIARTDYMLITIDENPGELRLADLLCLSLHRGTRVMLASGGQIPVEKLTPGMRLLTRDHGAQELRFMGKTTLRARGAFAPVVIPAGVMGNEGELVIGAHQRLFVYNRSRLPGQTQSELLVQARHLVDGERIYTREGGFADYFSLVFDQHEMIYAEGLAVESLRVHHSTLATLPSSLREEVSRELPGLSQGQHQGQEVDASLLPALNKRLRGLYTPSASASRRSA